MKQLQNEVLLQRLCEETVFCENFSFSVAGGLSLWQAEPREEILPQGELPGRLYYLVRGAVKLTQALANGKAVTLDLPRAPCFLGELELLCPQRTAVSVRAQTRCWLLGLEIDRYREKLLADPVFLRKLCAILAKKERLRARALAQAQAYPLANRLALFILAMAQGNRYRVRNVDACQFLGVSYRHLQQTMGDFVAQGLLQKQAGEYRLADLDRLRALAAEPAQDWEGVLE